MMENYNLYGEQNGDHSSMYPQGDGNGSISDAPTIAKGDQDPLEGCNEALDSYQAQNKDLDKAYAVLRVFKTGKQKEISGFGTTGSHHCL
jgi:hypothetical protein